MTINKFERFSSRMGHSGLALIGGMARISGLDGLCQRISPKKNPHIPEREIIRTLCALICQGKSDFDNVRQVMDDDFIQASLEYGQRMVKDVPLLTIMDSGFDNAELMGILHRKQCSEFIIKYNLRRESEQEWLEEARSNESGNRTLKTARKKRQSITAASANG